MAVDILRKLKPHYLDRLIAGQASGVAFHLATPVFHELVLGAYLSARRDYHLRTIDELRARMVEHDFTCDDADEAAEIRAHLIRQGRKIELPDVLIAGQARRRGWTVVTSNLRHFESIPQLDVTSWD